MATEDTGARPSPADTETNVDPSGRLAAGTLVAARYRVVEQLGLGGMGIVYRAFDEELGLEIALKVLRPDLGADPEWIERFRRELLLAREVTHKNVVRIHDIGESDGLRFLTMSLVPGRSLLDILSSGGPLPVERALRIFRQLAEALYAAHSAGVVHRDLKPANVLIGPEDTAFVTDFGVARSLLREGVTQAGTVVGTLDYLSPEQAAGDPVDARSDIYALGIVLFEMLTGELPFRGDSRAEVLAQRLTGRPRDIADTGTRVPAQVRRVIRRCLERSPARRYASAAELLRDLDAGRGALAVRLPKPAALLLLVAAVAAGSTGLYRYTRARSLQPPNSAAPIGVAVLPLADETGDAALGWAATGIADMLSSQLAELRELRVLGSLRVERTLKDVGLAKRRHDEAELRRIADLLEVSRLVTGSLRQAGSTLRVDLRLSTWDGAGGVQQRYVAAETKEKGELFRLVSELSSRLRGELGAPAGVGAPAPETASLEAAAAYRAARERLLVGDSLGAAPAFERAVAADPGFAAAHLGLSEALQALGYHDKAVLAAEKAGQLLSGSESRLAWRARARTALLGGRPDAAERAYAELVQRYPNDGEALLDLAAAQAESGAIAKAVATLRRVTELDRGDPRGWFRLGKNMILAGDARQALADPLLRALALMTQLRNEQGQGDVLNAMGVAHQRLGEYHQAAAKYGEAAALRLKVGDTRGTAVSLKNRGSIQLSLGRFAEAEPDFVAAREIYTKIGDKKGVADVWNDFGALHEGRGEYDGARKSYQEALRIRRALGDEQALAQSYDNVGYIFFLEGEYDNALVYWRQALELRSRIGDKSGVVLSTQNLGFLQIVQGRWSEAMKSFALALEQARALDFAAALAVSHGNIALLHHYEGRYAEALEAFGEALRILKGLDDKRGLAEYTIKQASLLVELGRLDEARQKLAAAAGWLEQAANRERAADHRLVTGELHLARGEELPARRAFDEAVEHAKQSRSRAAELRARISRAAARVALSDASAAPELLQAVEHAESLGDELLRVRAIEALARAELLRGRLRQAEEAARRAIKAADRCAWQAGLFRLHALLGRIREKQGDLAGAGTAYHESARRIARLSEGLGAELRRSFEGVPAVREVAAWVAEHPQTAAR
jgi:tetratricopeptide (TPR) repeat protein